MDMKLKKMLPFGTPVERIPGEIFNSTRHVLANELPLWGEVVIQEDAKSKRAFEFPKLVDNDRESVSEEHKFTTNAGLEERHILGSSFIRGDAVGHVHDDVVENENVPNEWPETIRYPNNR